MKSNLCIAFCLCFVRSICFAQDSTEHTVPGRTNSSNQKDKPYVILISADGFRYDYAVKYNAVNLLRLSDNGIRSQGMIPSYPSVTFPNHYSVATGMYPSHHGIVYNKFYDRKRKESYAVDNRKAVEDGTWWGGVPLWVLAENQGMVTAAYGYVGTEAAIQNTYSTYWYRYNKTTTVEKGVAAVERWLSLPDSIRPHLITFYISEADDAGHDHGPDSKETKEAVLFIDKMIRLMMQKVKASKLPVNIIFLADHGMANVDTVTRINVRSMIDTAKFIIKDGSTSMHLYAKDTADILSTYHHLKSVAKGFSVYLRDSIPAKFHYSTKEDVYNRIGDIYILPQYPHVLSSWKGKINPGTHGYDPAMKEMHAVFYAWGPNFKKGKTIGSFENVHVYPMVCRLLGLKYDHAIDGRAAVLEEIVK